MNSRILKFWDYFWLTPKISEKISFFRTGLNFRQKNHWKTFWLQFGAERNHLEDQFLGRFALWWLPIETGSRRMKEKPPTSSSWLTRLSRTFFCSTVSSEFPQPGRCRWGGPINILTRSWSQQSQEKQEKVKAKPKTSFWIAYQITSIVSRLIWVGLRNDWLFKWRRLTQLSMGMSFIPKLFAETLKLSSTGDLLF